MVREKAAVGMGEKGRGYGGDMVTMPLKTIWTVKEMLVLDQIRQDLNLYKTAEGHTPKSNEEFMEKIIKKYNVKLPDLPPGHKYEYDPVTDELTILRPKNLPGDP